MNKFAVQTTSLPHGAANSMWATPQNVMNGHNDDAESPQPITKAPSPSTDKSPNRRSIIPTLKMVTPNDAQALNLEAREQEDETSDMKDPVDAGSSDMDEEMSK